MTTSELREKNKDSRWK